MPDTRAHTLVITATGEDDDYDWQIACPWNGERNAPGRPCTTWWECDCKLTDEQKTALSDNGEGPCPTSPTGWHRPMSFGPSYPGLECWASECSSTTDEVGDIFREHGAGTFAVSVEDADEDSVVLAVMPAVSAPSPTGGMTP